MDYLVKDKKVKLQYEPGKGAWTYHIQIPNTKHIIGKWGSIKVSGFIDDYKIESKNLFTIKGQDKLLSVSETIRKAINKGGGDFVTVTLYLLTTNKKLSKQQILDTFKESGVLKQFVGLTDNEKNEIFESILSQKTEDGQVRLLIKYIDKLSR
jgi:Domain of unknown function (DUF1905)